MNEATSTPKSRELSGRWLVVGMFAFAVTATGILYVYWSLHVGPFLPLQQALADAYEDSRPRVEGGQRKMHKGTPMMLRVTMKVEFDPTAESGKAEAFADEIADFTRTHYDLQPYELLQLHFYWPEPEREIKQWSTERKVSELLTTVDATVGAQ